MAAPRAASAEASTRSARKPRPGREKVTASDASDSPYTGVRASGSKPQRAKRPSTSVETGSAPFSASRQDDRSTPSISSSRTRFTHRP